MSRRRRRDPRETPAAGMTCSRRCCWRRGNCSRCAARWMPSSWSASCWERGGAGGWRGGGTSKSSSARAWSTMRRGGQARQRWPQSGIACLGTAGQAIQAEGEALELMESDVARPRWADRSAPSSPPAATSPGRLRRPGHRAVHVRLQRATVARHALVVVVDYNMGGMARDGWVSSHVDKLLEQARLEAAGNALLGSRSWSRSRRGRCSNRHQGRPGRRARPHRPEARERQLQRLSRASRGYASRRCRPASTPRSAACRGRLQPRPPGDARRTSSSPRTRRRTSRTPRLRPPVRRPHHRLRLRPGLRPADAGEPDQVPRRSCSTGCRARPLPTPREQDAMPHVLSAWAFGRAPDRAWIRGGRRATLDAVWEAIGPLHRGLPGSDRLRAGAAPQGTAAARRRPVGAGPARVRVPRARRAPARHSTSLDLTWPHEADRRILLEIDHDRRDRPYGPGASTSPGTRRSPSRLWVGDPPELWEARPALDRPRAPPARRASTS